MEEESLTKREKRELAKEKKEKERKKKDRSKKLNNTIVFLFICFLVLFGGYKAYKWFTTPVDESIQEVFVVASDEWMMGEQDAKVTLIEYSDFQCPACSSYAPLMSQLTTDFEGGVRVVYRHLPLFTIHDNALDAAKASEAAGKQGKFWEMHDLLFENQEEWVNDASPRERFVQYAEFLELDMGKFEVDYEGKEVEDKVNEDLQSANRLRLNSTPTFFLNGKKIKPPSSYDDFKSKVEDVLEEG